MRAAVWLAAFLGLSSSACGPTVDLNTGLQVLDVSSGWYDAGVVRGENKLVPSVSFKLKNLSDQSLGSLHVNVTFRQVTGKDFDEVFKTVAGSEGLGPGAISQTVTVRSPHGYTGSEPRLEIMKNSQFVDAKVVLLAKYGSLQWTRLGEYAVERKLITN